MAVRGSILGRHRDGREVKHIAARVASSSATMKSFRTSRNSASILALILGMVAAPAFVPAKLTGIADAAWAGCAPLGGGSYLCSAPSTPETIVGPSLDVTADSTYTVDNTTPGGAGLNLQVSPGGTNLIFNQQSGSSISGENGAIVNNDGIGLTTVTTAGEIRTVLHGGSEQEGLRINSGFASAGVVFNQTAGVIDGGLGGLFIQNLGIGDVIATVAGDITGRNDNGVYIGNIGSTPTNITLTQSAGTITGGVTGINVQNQGTGSTSVTTSGTVISNDVGSTGIFAVNFSATTTDLSVTQKAGSVTSAGTGISAQNNGTGSTTVSLAGAVTATAAGAYGVQAYNNGLATQNVSVTQSGGTINAGFDAIHAVNFGTGTTMMTVNGTVTSATGAALHTTAANGATINIGATAIVSSGSGTAIRDGAFADEATDGFGGNAIVNSAGTVTGDAILGLGDDTFNLTGGSYTGNIYGDDRDDPQSDDGLVNHEGDDTFNWSGGTLAGGLYGQDGSDTALISAATYDGSQILDGGDDTSGVDHMIDQLTFKGTNATSNGSKIVNWEIVTLDGATLIIDDGAWKVGKSNEPSTGVFLTNGSTLNGMGSLALDGNLDIDASSSFIARGGGTGVYSISGFVTNAGLISSRDGHAGDVINIERNYTGDGGTIELDTVLGDDASVTDKVNIAGNTDGSSFVSVTNAGGGGAQTDEGIEIITVADLSNGNFELVGSYDLNGKPAVVGGAYAYQLYKGNRTGSETKNWYLRSELIPDEPLYQTGVPSYEAYPQALLGLNGLPTLQQRIGNRFWAGNGNGVIGQGADIVGMAAPALEGAGPTVDSNGIWGRIEGAHNRMEPRLSTSGTDYRQNILKLQAGVDGLLSENENGVLIGGITVHYTHGQTRTSSVHGDGEISTDGYGFGGTLTWYGDNGFYLDGQGQVTWYDSDLSSKLTGGKLTDGNSGFGYALSLESGKRIAIDPEWSITPQAQLVYSDVRFDDFADVFGAPVSLDRGSSLQGRLGVTLDREKSWQNDKGLLNRTHVYGIANLYYEFLDGTRIDVDGVSFASRNDRLWGGVGLGGSYNWDDDKYSLFGEGLFNTSLNNFGDSYVLKAQLGLRIKW
ncbi:autotransporter family protein [Aminobacter sp. HY435]|uniref:autotransporter family protein n=1 Tax=Aminobacter sp. HY435 TaxID=2970917 RepID=UPI0022B98C3F|nr:autotransporter outer membrane beta-barrel domain-containing protein [Aminobacter sp. HY435]